MDEIHPASKAAGWGYVPFKPVGMNRHFMRYERATERLWEEKDFDQGDQPSRHEENIFDFGDGMRIVISRQLLPSGREGHGDEMEEFIHFTGAVTDTSKIMSELQAGKYNYDRVVSMISGRFLKISGLAHSEINLQMTGISPESGSPHFHIRREQLDKERAKCSN